MFCDNRSEMFNEIITYVIDRCLVFETEHGSSAHTQTHEVNYTDRRIVNYKYR
jgi:hypothetical protein